MKTIEDLRLLGDPFIRELAERAERYKTEYIEGRLSDAEYEKLCAELTDLDALRASANRADLELALAEAVQVLARFVKL